MFNYSIKFADAHFEAKLIIFFKKVKFFEKYFVSLLKMLTLKFKQLKNRNVMKKVFRFLVGTKVGLLILINVFFAAGLFAASKGAPFMGFLGGLIWFASNALVMVFAYKAEVPTSDPNFPVKPPSFEDVGGGATDPTVIVRPDKKP